jgi:hypothetical protein
VNANQADGFYDSRDNNCQKDPRCDLWIFQQSIRIRAMARSQDVETVVKLFFLFNFIILSNIELCFEFIILCNS